LEDWVNFTVFDGTFLVFKVIYIQIIPVNDPPEIANIPRLDIVEDETHFLNLTDYVTDIDTDIPTMEFTTNMDDADVLVEVYQDVLNITYVKQNGLKPYEERTVNLTVFDGKNYFYRHFKMLCYPSNDAPVVALIEPISVETGYAKRIDLSPYITDVDTPLKNIVLSTESDSASIIGMEVELFYEDFLYNEDQKITDELITIKVIDGQETMYADLSVTIEMGNLRPSLADFNYTYANEGLDNDSYVFSAFCTDIGGDGVSMTLVINGEEHSMSKTSGDLETGAKYEVSVVLPKGDYEYYFNVTDNTDSGNSDSTSESFTLSVAEAPVEDTSEEELLTPENVEFVFLIAAFSILGLTLLFFIIKKVIDAKADAEPDVDTMPPQEIEQEVPVTPAPAEGVVSPEEAAAPEEGPAAPTATLEEKGEAPPAEADAEVSKDNTPGQGSESSPDEADQTPEVSATPAAEEPPLKAAPESEPPVANEEPE